MGLDNGIVLRRKDRQKIELPSFVKDMWESIDTDGAVELAYWRKCWGIRDRIINLFGGENDNGHYNIDANKLLEIIKILNKFLHKEYWDEYADSIWEYDEHIERSVEILINLSWLSWYMLKEQDNIEVYFYDSY